MQIRVGRIIISAALIGAACCIPSPPPLLAAPAEVNETDHAEAVIAKAFGYLKAHQNEDGSWQSPKEPPGITAIVIKAFAQDPSQKMTEPFLAKGIERMKAYQNPDGSVGEALLTYNTAITISAMVATKEPSLKDSIAKAVGYLRSSQFTDKIQGIDKNDPKYGGWGYGNMTRPDLSNVQTALDAMRDAGLSSDDPAYKAALEFVTRSQNFSEQNKQPWAGNDGSFIYSPADGGMSSAGEMVDADGKRTLRGYGSMTYAGLKSMLYAGLTRDDPRVKAAWKWIGNNWTLDDNPGLKGNNPRAGDSGLFYYYHTMARALRAYGDPIIVDAKGNKHDWRVELIAKLEKDQNPDGSWTGTQKWMENRPVISTSFGILALEEAVADLKANPVK